MREKFTLAIFTIVIGLIWALLGICAVNGPCSQTWGLGLLIALVGTGALIYLVEHTPEALEKQRHMEASDFMRKQLYK